MDQVIASFRLDRSYFTLKNDKNFCSRVVVCVKGLLYNLLWSIFQVRYEEEEDLWLAFMDGRVFLGNSIWHHLRFYHVCPDNTCPATN